MHFRLAAIYCDWPIKHSEVNNAWCDKLTELPTLLTNIFLDIEPKAYTLCLLPQAICLQLCLYLILPYHCHSEI